MKNLALFFILSFFCITSASAQDSNSKTPTKIIFGVVFASQGTTTFSDWNVPFTLGYNLSPNICVVTNKTYHNLLYGFSNNTLRNVNGYFLNSKKDLGGYVAFGKSLSLKGGYVTAGIEKTVKAGSVNFFLFSEVQANIDHDSKTKDFQLNIGVHINIQTPLYVKK